jgi:hypothetical protein
MVFNLDALAPVGEIPNKTIGIGAEDQVGPAAV